MGRPKHPPAWRRHRRAREGERLASVVGDEEVAVLDGLREHLRELAPGVGDLLVLEVEHAEEEAAFERVGDEAAALDIADSFAELGLGAVDAAHAVEVREVDPVQRREALLPGGVADLFRLGERGVGAGQVPEASGGVAEVVERRRGGEANARGPRQIHRLDRGLDGGLELTRVDVREHALLFAVDGGREIAGGVEPLGLVDGAERRSRVARGGAHVGGEEEHARVLERAEGLELLHGAAAAREIPAARRRLDLRGQRAAAQRRVVPGERVGLVEARVRGAALWSATSSAAFARSAPSPPRAWRSRITPSASTSAITPRSGSTAGPA